MYGKHTLGEKGTLAATPQKGNNMTPITYVFQPNAEWCDKINIYSWEVFAHLKCGKSIYPTVPDDAWCKYEEGTIEAPEFIDWPECDQ